MLKETLPQLSYVVSLKGPGLGLSPALQKDVEAAARALGLKLEFQEAMGSDDLTRALDAITKARAGAVNVAGGPWTIAQRKQIVEFAAKHRLPAIYHRRAFVEAGGLMSYATNRDDLARRAAVFVDKILKGTTPADLPVEQPIKFEFIVNLTAAKQIGLTMPPNLLVRANRVIK